MRHFRAWSIVVFARFKSIFNSWTSAFSLIHSLCEIVTRSSMFLVILFKAILHSRRALVLIVPFLHFIVVVYAFIYFFIGQSAPTAALVGWGNPYAMSENSANQNLYVAPQSKPKTVVSMFWLLMGLVVKILSNLFYATNLLLRWLAGKCCGAVFYWCSHALVLV